MGWQVRLLFPLVLCGLCALPPLAMAGSGSSIAVGDRHSCGLTSGGGVKCWGANDSGQLGDGSGSDQHTPVFVQGLQSGVAAVVAGSHHTCALTVAGAMKCWGYNASGQTGDGTYGDATYNRHTPVDVVGLQSGVVAIGTGFNHTCAVMGNGTAKCWGDNTVGQLGLGYRDVDPVPAPVFVRRVNGRVLRDVVAISGGLGHTCALHSYGGLECWGRNWYGQLGDGNAGASVFREAADFVYRLKSGVVAVATGGQHTCAALNTGAIKCWGYNGNGNLGNGTTTQSSYPVTVKGWKGGVAAAIHAGTYHNCAVTDAAAVKCWGANSAGQLGDGTLTIRYTPVLAKRLKNVTAIATFGAADPAHTCVSLAGGGAKCSGGNNFGQLGDGNSGTYSTLPVPVEGL